jgi:nucleotide-binding universal stress UspA family protein
VTARRGVVVGVDGSRASDDALRYACSEASARRLPLTLVHAWQPYLDTTGAFWTPVPRSSHDPESVGLGILNQAAVLAAAIAPDVVTEIELLQAPTLTALESCSVDALLLVVGGRDRGGHDMGWVGPVPVGLTTGAHCPVIVVPSAPHVGGDVVVGVDGSDVSTTAIAFAFEQASVWKANVCAVHAYSTGHSRVMPPVEWLAELHEAARLALSESLVGWLEKYPDVRLTELVSTAHPMTALRLATDDAGLLVVGTHGRGPLLRRALGSVSSALLRVTACPVAVVGQHAR